MTRRTLSLFRGGDCRIETAPYHLATQTAFWEAVFRESQKTPGALGIGASKAAFRKTALLLLQDDTLDADSSTEAIAAELRRLNGLTPVAFLVEIGKRNRLFEIELQTVEALFNEWLQFAVKVLDKATASSWPPSAHAQPQWDTWMQALRSDEVAQALLAQCDAHGCPWVHAFLKANRGFQPPVFRRAHARENLRVLLELDLRPAVAFLQDLRDPATLALLEVLEKWEAHHEQKLTPLEPLESIQRRLRFDVVASEPASEPLPPLSEFMENLRRASPALVAAEQAYVAHYAQYESVLASLRAFTQGNPSNRVISAR